MFTLNGVDGAKKWMQLHLQIHEIIDYINQNYYAVKLDAERKDTVVIDGKMFINPNPTATVRYIR